MSSQISKAFEDFQKCFYESEPREANVGLFDDLGSIPGGEDPLEEGMQPIPVFLPGESPWTEEPGRLQSMGLQRVGYD